MEAASHSYRNDHAETRTTLLTQLLAIGLMYGSQGIPAGLAFNAFSTILRHSGTSLKEIGLTGLVFLPWALKCFWSGIADNAGKRWGYGALALWTHMSAVAVCLLLGFASPGHHFLLALSGILLLNTIFATQDIFTNACAVSHMKGRNAGLANALQVISFLLGMVVGGAGSLFIYERLGWSGAMWGAACELFILWLALLPLRGSIEPDRGFQKPSRLMDLFQQPGFRWALLMATSFKFASSALAMLLQPWVMDQSFSLGFAGTLQMSNIICGALGGAFIGFPAVRFLGCRRAVALLIWPSTLLLGTLVCLQTRGMATPMLLYAGLGIENFLDGGFYVSVWATLMNWSSEERPGMDYSFLQCGESLANVLAGMSIAPLASVIGYSRTFLTTWIVGAFTLLLVVTAARKLAGLCDDTEPSKQSFRQLRRS
ncbi:MFS transporter [Acetobacter sicerae]|uniref:MFS transporter n=1 Tax=Acetobacter sicerae TaxID=85325 RepID=UPI00156BD6EC|nr:MFS transporter [Acetobacter sicerae]NHN93573.1 permease [Acetobacter sicerae]